MVGDVEPETHPTATPPGRARSLIGRVLQARERPRSPWLLLIAITLFLAFTLVAIRALPHVDKPIRWELILIAALGCVPIITALNALEFRLMCHFAEHHPPLIEILQITVLGSAANLLPVPGAVVVRVANLRKAGVKVSRGLNLTAIIGLAWLGSAAVLGGLVEIWLHTTFALVTFAIGAALLSISVGMLVRILEPDARIKGVVELLAIEAGSILMQALRLFLIGSALRFNVSYAQTTTLVIAAVAAAAIGFLPAGLGAREGIAAILSPIVGLPAAVGLVITAVDRVVSLAILSVFAGAVALVTRHERKLAATSAPSD